MAQLKSQLRVSHTARVADIVSSSHPTQHPTGTSLLWLTSPKSQGPGSSPTAAGGTAAITGKKRSTTSTWKELLAGRVGIEQSGDSSHAHHHEEFDSSSYLVQARPTICFYY